MDATRTCGECGLPLGVAGNLDWNSDGTITQRKDPQHRLILFESDNLDRLWSRLSEMLGVTREHVWELVTESKSRATRAFLYRTLPWYVSLAARVIGYRTMISSIESQGLVMGYGKITVGGQFPRRGRPERITVLVEDPYSLPLFCGDFKGAAEVLERRTAGITYQALDARRHQIDVTVRQERLEDESFRVPEEAPRKPGDIQYRRCGTCGSPLELKQFSWDLESGVIREVETGRRMALFGTPGLLSVFEALEHELGDRVTGSIIEAERENTVAAMGREEAEGGFEALRMRAALRGLGLLYRLELEEWGMGLSMSNPAVTPYVLGLALGIFELVTGSRGHYEWSLKEDGDLVAEIGIKP